MVKSKVGKSAQKPGAKKTTAKAVKLTPAKHLVAAAHSAGAKHVESKVAGNGHSRLQTLSNSEQLAQAQQTVGTIKTQSGADLTEKVKELIRLAQEQGYLTYNDINDALPDNIVTADELDEIYVKLRNLEIEIVDQAEVDRVKQPEPEEEEDKTRLDILDDPVRMYLKQMGQVPLLTREQEVEISKRIEDAETEVKRIIYSFGFAGKEHIALAEKLVSEPPKERFDRVILDKKIDSRDSHVRELRKLIKHVRSIDQHVDDKYAEWQNGALEQKKEKLESAFKKADQKLHRTFDKFYYK